MSTILTVETLDQKTAFAPGESIDGVVSWSFAGQPRDVELRLLWYTSGMGDRDVAVPELLRFENPAPDDVKTFSFTAPAGPFSYSGKLITIAWALEAVVHKEKRTFSRIDLIIAPDRRELRPDLMDPDEKETPFIEGP